MRTRMTAFAVAIVAVLALWTGAALAAPDPAPGWSPDEMHASEQMRAMHAEMPADAQAQCDAMHAQMSSQTGRMMGQMHGQGWQR